MELHEDNGKCNCLSYVNENTERAIKKTFLLKVIRMFQKELWQRLHTGVVDGQKDQLDTEKPSRGIMNDDNKGTLMLTVVLVRSVKYGRSGNRKAQVKISRISKSK